VTHRCRRRAVCCVLFLASAAQILSAQTGPAARRLTFQGSLRSRAEFWDWFEGQADNAYVFSGNLLRLSVSQQRERFEWQLEAAAPVLLGLPTAAIAPGAQGQLGMGPAYFAANRRHRNTGMVFPKQAFLRWRSLGGNKAHTFRLGRFEFAEGAETAPQNPTLAALKRDRIAHRLVGNFGFTHVGRSVDGFQWALGRERTHYTVAGGLATRGVFQTDGWGNLHTAFGYAATTRQTGSARQSGEWRLLALYYHDWRNVLKTDNRPLALRRLDMGNVRIATFGGHYLHVADTSRGAADFLFWGVVQTGRWGLLRHRSGAFAVEGGWQPKALPRLRPWLRAGFFHGQGDDNPNDQTHGTFFQPLPTPRLYARFPFYNLMNIQDLFATLTLRPRKTVVVRADVRSLRLADRSDLWYAGGGAFQPWTFGYVGRPSGGGRGLAGLFDVSVDYQASARVSVAAYLAHARGKRVVQAIYPAGRNATFGYVELAWRF
jgi:hypothetical protein